MESKIRHLEIIQGAISRMASNSFLLKGWAVTLLAGIFALSSKEADKLYFLVAYIPIVMFWFIDAYYLLQERLFRELYDKVRIQTDENIDFSMDTTPKEYHRGKNKYLWCLVSKTILWFYLPLALISAGIIIISLT